MVEMTILLLIFIFGLCFGSFLNVLVYRLPRSLPITGRSFCPQCKKKIVWYDNIPLLSFIFLKGRCRNCHSPISWQYPLVELSTAVLTVMAYQLLTGQVFNFQLLFNLLIIYALITIFFADLRYEIIPDQIVYPAMVISIIYVALTTYYLLLTTFISAVVAAGFFFLLHWLTRGRGMGLGDVKLAGLMGLVLGFPGIAMALYLAFLTGAAWGVILILVGKKKLKSQIPFGPFLAGATIFTLFYGEAIWEKLIGVLL